MGLHGPLSAIMGTGYIIAVCIGNGDMVYWGFSCPTSYSIYTYNPSNGIPMVTPECYTHGTKLSP